MRRKPGLGVFKFILLGALFATVLGFVVMSLWNWLIPCLFTDRSLRSGRRWDYYYWVNYCLAGTGITRAGKATGRKGCAGGWNR